MEKILREIDTLKKEINALSVDAQLQSQIKNYYRISFSYTSNALEGNSLTEIETKVILEDGIAIGGKPLKHHLEAVGLSDAYEFLYEEDKRAFFSEETIKRFYWLFYYRIDDAYAGKYRDIKVFLSGSKYSLPDPEEVPQLMASWLSKVDQGSHEVHPVDFAARAHKELVFIHPFIDGNGRVARLLMNLILLQHGYNPCDYSSGS